MIRWDSSLFNAPYLPPPENRVTVARIDNHYFWGVNNSGYDHFNMLNDNEAYAPAYNWGTQSQFPMTFNLSLLPVVGIMENNMDYELNLFPNPFVSELNIFSSVSIKEYEIITIEGKRIIKSNNAIEKNNLITIPCENLPPGIYFLRILNTKNQIYYEKIIKF